MKSSLYNESLELAVVTIFFFFQCFIELWILRLNDKNSRNHNISLFNRNVQSLMKWLNKKEKCQDYIMGLIMKKNCFLQKHGIPAFTTMYKKILLKNEFKNSNH